MKTCNTPYYCSHNSQSGTSCICSCPDFCNYQTPNTINLSYVRDTNHDWYCACGHWNGCNLAICALCGRTPGESLSR
jgi:hypothetical protein